MSSGVSDQARHKPACTATEASQSLEISAIESRDIILFKQRTTKVLIRLRGCAGWSAPLLFAYDIRHIFSWPGSYKSWLLDYTCTCNDWITCVLSLSIVRFWPLNSQRWDDFLLYSTWKGIQVEAKFIYRQISLELSMSPIAQREGTCIVNERIVFW